MYTSHLYNVALTVNFFGRCGGDIAASKSRREMQLAATYNNFCLLYLLITPSHFRVIFNHLRVTFNRFRITFNHFESTTPIL